MRVIDKHTVVVQLHATRAVVKASLKTPMDEETLLRAGRASFMEPIPCKIELGPYENLVFLDSILHLPKMQPRRRMNYRLLQ